jgi:hypothetical protein
MGNEDERRTASARVVNPARILGSGAISANDGVFAGGSAVQPDRTAGLSSGACGEVVTTCGPVGDFEPAAFDLPPHPITTSNEVRAADAKKKRGFTRKGRRAVRCTRTR